MPNGLFALCLIVFGVAMFRLAWMLLREYRAAFFQDPVRTMSFDLLAQILKLGAPGMLGALGMLIGAWFVFFGVVTLFIPYQP